jgi:putative peptidoglycan lipid II flippase
VNFFALALLMRKKIKRLNGNDIILSFLKIAAASAVLSTVCYAVYHFMLGRYGTSGLGLRFAEAFLPIALGGIAFIVVAKLLRVRELEQLFGMLRRRFAR